MRAGSRRTRRTGARSTPLSIAVAQTSARSCIRTGLGHPVQLTDVPLRPIYHLGSVIGQEILVWDIARLFGETDLLVRDATQADSLAAALRLGAVRSLSAGETKPASEMLRDRVGERAWEYWVRRLPR